MVWSFLIGFIVGVLVFVIILFNSKKLLRYLLVEILDNGVREHYVDTQRRIDEKKEMIKEIIGGTKK